MKWTDTREIALALAEKLPDIDPRVIRFMQLRPWVLELNRFNDEPDNADEKLLETIQMLWIEQAGHAT